VTHDVIISTSLDEEKGLCLSKTLALSHVPRVGESIVETRTKDEFLPEVAFEVKRVAHMLASDPELGAVVVVTVVPEFPDTDPDVTASLLFDAGWKIQDRQIVEPGQGIWKHR
jgi:hypothetical protein